MTVPLTANKKKYVNFEKFKIKILVAWPIFEGWLDQKQRIFFVWPKFSQKFLLLVTCT